MSSRYSEEEAVQKSASRRLRKFGWNLVYAWNEEELGQYGTLGRKSYCEIDLRHYFVKAPAELNEWLEPEQCEVAMDKLGETLVTDSPLRRTRKSTL